MRPNMAPHLYTIEQASELLNLHVKTVRRYVRDGRLKAKRIGKAYRIARTDLEDFGGGSTVDPVAPMRRMRHVIASSIIDVDVISPRESDRITTMVMAGMNARKGEGDFPRIDCIYYPEQARMRITLTASLELASVLLRMINALLENGEGSESRRKDEQA